MRSQMAQNVVKREDDDVTSKTPETAPERENEVARTAITDEDSETLEGARMAKKEVRKILITVAILIVAVVAVYFINTKTDFILKIGEWISKTLKISV